MLGSNEPHSRETARYEGEVEHPDGSNPARAQLVWRRVLVWRPTSSTPSPILFPPVVLTFASQKGSLVLRLMTQFARDFVSSIEGTSLEISTKELSGGARIYHIFHEVFGHALDSLEPGANLSPHEIRTAIRNSTGPRPSLFVPEVAFDLLVKPQIKLLEAPSLRCVELVYEELVKLCHNCTSHVCAPLLASTTNEGASKSTFTGARTLPPFT